MLEFSLIRLQRKLEKVGVDLSNNNYYRHPEFINIDLGMAIGLGMSVDWAIEYYLIGQERLEKIYGCYDLRIHRELTNKELQQISWQTILADELQDYFSDSKDVYQYFNRKDKGLIARLKNLGIDIDAFTNQSEKIRLLYFLCIFEKKHNIKITPFLSNPTLENVDNRCMGFIIRDAYITRNGDLIRELKNSIARGISSDFIKKTKNVICTIARQWEDEICKISGLLDSKTNIYELNRINNNIERLIKILNTNDKKHGLYAHSLLETVYLKLSQHENIGRENDIIDVQNSTREAFSDLPNVTSNRYLPLIHDVIKKEDIDLFIKNNRSYLARLVYDKDVISSNEYKKFDTAVTQIPSFLETLYKHSKAYLDAKYYEYYLNTEYHLNLIEVVPVLLIIACIQEILFEKNDKIENKFYGYKSSDQKTLRAEIKNGKDASMKNQIALISRAIRRMDCIAGRNKESELCSKIETKIDIILRKILTCNSIDDMLYLNNFFKQFFRSLSLTREDIEHEAKKFTDAITTGYIFDIKEPFMYEYFFGTIFNSSITLDLANSINNYICNSEKDKKYEDIIFPIEIELTDVDDDTRSTYEAIFLVDPSAKKVHLLVFRLKIDKEGEQRLIENGIMIYSRK